MSAAPPTLGRVIDATPPRFLLDRLADALRSPHPLDFLELASTMVHLSDGDAGEPGAVRANLIETLLAHGARETDAVLMVWSHMLDAPALRERLAATRRRHSLPRWLHQLDQVRPTRALENTHILGDGDNILLGIETPGRSFTLVIYIDHNMGTIVKDAFAVEVPISEMLGRIESLRDDDTSLNELLLEDARAKLSDAVAHSGMLFDPIETETWPELQAFTEWMIRLLPEGGVGYESEELSDEEWAALLRDFGGSPFAEGLDAAGLDRAEALFGLAATFGTGDPLRWSNVVVEVVLLDLIPRQIMAEDTFLQAFPATMPHVIRYAHDRRGIPARYTEEALAAIEEFGEAYLDVISGPRSEAWEGDDDVPTLEYLTNLLARRVGGREALEGLDTELLPDEALDLDGAPEDVRERVTAISALADDVCTGFFGDVELRTVARRLIAWVAASDPSIFRRRGKDETAAAAICWIAAKDNEYLGYRFAAQDMMAYLGLSGSPSQRAQPMLRALGADPDDWSFDPVLGDVELLTSAARQRVLERREPWEQAFGDAEVKSDAAGRGHG